MLDFLRPELAELQAYTPHPGGEITTLIDRLDTNESPFDLPIELKEKFTEIYKNHIETNRYPDGSHWKLKQKLAEYINESTPTNTPITHQNISLGNGSDEVIRSLLMATCLNNQGAILTANPTFSMYEILAKTLGISVVTVDRSTEDFSLNLSSAQKALETTQNPPIRVLCLVHPNSPTGNPLTSAEMDWVRSLSPSILVILDEAYFEFCQTSFITELEKHPNWVILRTFSKAFRLASHRVGYAIGHPELITTLEKIRLPYNLPTDSLTVAELALTHRHLFYPSLELIINERQRMYQQLSQFSRLKTWESTANFFYIRLAEETENSQKQLAEITQKLKQQGTLIRHTGGGLRVTVGTPQENDRTLQRLLALSEKWV